MNEIVLQDINLLLLQVMPKQKCYLNLQYMYKILVNKIHCFLLDKIYQSKKLTAVKSSLEPLLQKKATICYSSEFHIHN